MEPTETFELGSGNLFRFLAGERQPLYVKKIILEDVSSFKGKLQTDWQGSNLTYDAELVRRSWMALMKRPKQWAKHRSVFWEPVAVTKEGVSACPEAPCSGGTVELGFLASCQPQCLSLFFCHLVGGKVGRPCRGQMAVV